MQQQAICYGRYLVLNLWLALRNRKALSCIAIFKWRMCIFFINRNGSVPKFRNALKRGRRLNVTPWEPKHLGGRLKGLHKKSILSILEISNYAIFFSFFLNSHCKECQPHSLQPFSLEAHTQIYVWICRAKFGMIFWLLHRFSRPPLNVANIISGNYMPKKSVAFLSSQALQSLAVWLCIIIRVKFTQPRNYMRMRWLLFWEAACIDADIFCPLIWRVVY